MLDLHIDLVVITFISFIALIFLLNKILYQPLLNFMETRDNSIQNDIDTASKNIGAIGDAETEVQENIKEARHTSDQLKLETIQKAQYEQSKQVLELREELDKNYESFVKNLHIEKEISQKEILSKVSILTKILTKKLTTI